MICREAEECWNNNSTLLTENKQKIQTKYVSDFETDNKNTSNPLTSSDDGEVSTISQLTFPGRRASIRSITGRLVLIEGSLKLAILLDFSASSNYKYKIKQKHYMEQQTKNVHLYC